MKTIRLETATGGLVFRYAGRQRFVPDSMLGTPVETRALRELTLGNSLPVAVAMSNTRAPGDWPQTMRANDRAVLGL